jgi:N-hydroxyarylamine O-acetyltransferase
MDANEYLKRLGLSKQTPSLKYLKAIIKSHLTRIPYETLDFKYRKRIILDYDRIYHKIIKSRRGGYGYELNGLLYILLKNLGFNIKLIAAFLYNDSQWSSEMNHMCMVVTIENTPYLLDVGRPKNIPSPLQIKQSSIVLVHTSYYRFDCNVDGQWILSNSPDAIHFQPLLKTDLSERQPIQFLSWNDRFQDDPDSEYNQSCIITRMTSQGGFKSLSDKTFVNNQKGEEIREEILNEEQFIAKLEQEFGINGSDLA